ncbi:5'-methylthioadenosine/adenosylhomocysteine nucleosidase [Kytococcus sedentarius]|uniref:5'-methylthioadenosine/adenosylhomocysteine nucleosidase n=1 Tax=Kytococcus sedentarius TaxID=1276 RepID=UPI0035BC2D5A
MGAIEAEVVQLRGALGEASAETVLGQEVVTGRLEGADVAVLRCGVGKVNAALGAAALRTVGVDRIVFTGVAGGLAPEVGIGDVVVADDVVQHDVDVTALGRAPGELLGEPATWVADAGLRAACERAAGQVVDGAAVHTGRIASGDQFIASVVQRGRIVEQFGALAAEMEGAAMAQACARMGVPWAVVRSISDSADAGAVTDFPAFLDMAAHRGVALARELVRGGA